MRSGDNYIILLLLVGFGFICAKYLFLNIFFCILGDINCLNMF